MHANQATSVYLDPAVPLGARVCDLLERMTLVEKISQMRHDAAAITRLNMPAYNGLNGILDHIIVHACQLLGTPTGAIYRLNLLGAYLEIRAAHGISAQARHVMITLQQVGSMATLEIADDGIGFDPAQAQVVQGGLGLRGMNERMTQLGGCLLVQSTPGTGT